MSQCVYVFRDSSPLLYEIIIFANLAAALRAGHIGCMFKVATMERGVGDGSSFR